MTPLIVSAVIVEKVVERIKALVPEKVSGHVTTAVSFALGLGLAYLGGIGISEVGVDVTGPADLVLGGLAIGLGAGVIADVTGRG